MEWVELGKVCDVIAGQSPPSSTYNQDKNGLPFFQGKADFGALHPTVRHWCTMPKKISEENDILFSVRAPVGATNINNTKATIGRGIAAIRCSDNINTTFLLHFLRKNEKRIANLGTGSTFKAITIKTLKELKIPLPSLSEQKRIAKILDQADEIRQLNQKLIAKYEALTQSLFLEMFQSGKYPKQELTKFIKLIGGGTPSKDNDSYWNGSIPWASVKDLKSNKLSSTIDSITQEGVDNSATKIVKKGSLIIATRMAVARTAICDIDVAINQDLKAVQIKKDINIIFLKHLIDSKRKHLINLSSGATVKGIKMQHITNLKPEIPRLSLETQFAERVEQIEAQKAIAMSALSKSEDLFNGLLQKAFKGEL